jgi:hypothetical protein
MLKTNDLYLRKLEDAQQRAISGFQRKVASALPNNSKLDTDILGGFTRAVHNGQQRLALEYLIELVEVQAAQIAELQEAIESKDAKDEATEFVPASTKFSEKGTTADEEVILPEKKSARRKAADPVEDTPAE